MEIGKIGICLLSETHFTNEISIRIEGYKVYHSMQPDFGAEGDNAIYHNKITQGNEILFVDMSELIHSEFGLQISNLTLVVVLD